MGRLVLASTTKLMRRRLARVVMLSAVSSQDEDAELGQDEGLSGGSDLEDVFASGGVVRDSMEGLAAS
jgi:hypothetical protein